MSARENDRLAQEITDLHAAARRTAEWSNRLERTKIGEHAADRGFIGAQSARVMKRAKSAERRQGKTRRRRKKSSLKDLERNDTLKITPLRHHSDYFGRSTRSFDRIWRAHRLWAAQLHPPAVGARRPLRQKRQREEQHYQAAHGRGHPAHGHACETAGGLIVSYMPQDTSFLQGNVLDYARGKRSG